METSDTYGRRRIAALWVLLVAGALGIAGGCQAKKASTSPAATATCDPNHDYQQCNGEAAVLTCDSGSKIWLQTAYCNGGSHCAEVSLPKDTTPLGASVAQCVGGRFGGGDAQAGDGAAMTGPATGVIVATDATATATSGDASAKDTPAINDGAPSGLCGNGICDSGETAKSCALDCGEPVCGDGVCGPKEAKASCAWDCVPGAAAGADCMVAKCPAQGQLCTNTAGCLLALAQVWACAQGCAGCLPKCLQAISNDVVAFQVVSCAAAACVGPPP